ncbi:MAG: RluA family pseudouridine synthase [Clostridia bacterium]|nr:RluA family pseudouridine synthase [Clostridia bacterium]
MRYIIPENEHGRTVKEILLGSVGISVTFLRHLKFIENGIMLNGEKVTVRKQVNAGDILELATENEKMGSRLTPSKIELDIIYEDSDLVVPSKPANMPTHPSHNHHGDTLADALAYRYANESEPFVFRPINRLDRNTSGLTLIARSRISAARLSESMRSGEIRKRYVAILDGALPSREGCIETYMRRTSESIIVREVCNEQDGGDYALTRYVSLAFDGRYSLVLASPETGRTHQLRVHFSHLGCPIVGDDMYGSASKLIDRHALHALTLSFPHPSSKEDMRLLAPLPDDMHSLCTDIFGENVLRALYTDRDIL